MCFENAHEYMGWDIYPQNLTELSSLDVDAMRCHRQISQLSKELFVAADESTFDYMGLHARNEGMYSVVSVAHDVLCWRHVVADIQKGSSRMIICKHLRTTDDLCAVMKPAQMASLLSVD